MNSIQNNNNNASLNNGRIQITQAQHESMIQAEVDRCVAAKETFTSYGVQMAVKHSHPGIELLSHEDYTRPFTHHYMSGLHTQGLDYGVRVADVSLYGGRQPYEYYPLASLPAPAISTDEDAPVVVVLLLTDKVRWDDEEEPEAPVSYEDHVKHLLDQQYALVIEDISDEKAISAAEAVGQTPQEFVDFLAEKYDLDRTDASFGMKIFIDGRPAGDVDGNPETV